MAASLNTQTVNDGFVQGAEAGVSVTIGVSAVIQVNMTIKAKTVSDVYKELSKSKSDFHEETWTKIEETHASASASFFYELLGISAGVSGGYKNNHQVQDIKATAESQAAARALHDTAETTVTLSGTLTATGQSYIPVTGYAFIHLIQISQNETKSFIAVADQPEGKVATKDGSQKDVTVNGKLNMIHASSPAVNVMNVPASAECKFLK